ncbi:hypothetical protein SAMD00024442_49_11 [Candidatus Symbiothrix dinenymphae]|nr:hypothetical protein SAMD00024442_49_11 [Candidatus Symbiothrix dinenymphae]
MELQIIQIQSKIHEVRGVRVMLDHDLAEAYGVETKHLKASVKRNMERFPPDFMFELTRDEYDFLRSKNSTLEIGRGKYSKYLPFVFTEHGVVMLSSVVNSPKAIQANIFIVREFIAVRQFLSTPPVERLAVLEHEVKRLTANIEDAFADYNDINEDSRMQFELINTSLAELQAYKHIINKPRKVVGFTADRVAPKTEMRHE